MKSNAIQTLWLSLLIVWVGLIAVSGCKPNTAGPSLPGQGKAEDTPLRVLVVDDPPLGEAIARQWKSRTESEVAIENARLEDIADAQRLPADVVVFPTSQLGLLAERHLIVPLPPEAVNSEQFASRDLFNQIRLLETRWGHTTASVPLGSPQLLFVYRADIFDELNLQPPQTWAEYQALVEQFNAPTQLPESVRPPDPDQWLPTAEPRATGQAGQLLLARAAAYVTHRDQVAALFHPDSMKPLIDSPPFVRALEELVAASSKGPASMSAADVVRSIAEREAPMGIGSPEAVAAYKSPDSDQLTSKLGFATLPGSADVFNFGLGQWETREADEQTRASLFGIAGRQAAVSSSARQTEAAVSFVGWLSSSEIASRISPSSPATAPFRKSQVPDAGRWMGLEAPASGAFAAALEQSLSQKQGLVLPRIPGQADYMAALDKAVEAAVSKQQPAEDALKTAAEHWQAVTDRLGREKQQLAYRRSLNVADWP